MRETVYLSQSKLRQFLPEPRKIARTGALQVTTPFGGVNLDAPAPDDDRGRLRHLQRVLKHLDRIADWFDGPLTNSWTTSIRPTMRRLSSANSCASNQSSRIVRPPARWSGLCSAWSGRSWQGTVAEPARTRPPRFATARLRLTARQR